MHSTANRLLPVLLLARNGTIGELPPGVLEDLHAGIVCALAVRDGCDCLGDVGRAATRIAGLFARDGSTESRAREMVSLGSTDAESAEIVMASTVLSNLSWTAGKLDDGMQWGRRAVNLAGRALPECWRPYPYLALAEKFIDIGELDEAEQLIRSAARQTAQRGVHLASADVDISNARLLYASSKFRAARQKICATVERAATIGADWTARHGLLLLTLTDLRRPDLRAACDSMWRCRAKFAGDALAHPSLQYWWAEYLVSTIGLSAQRAVEMFGQEYQDLLNSPGLFVMDAAAAPWLVRLAQTADDLLMATSVLAAVERLAATNPAYPTVEATALHARAVLRNDADGLRAAASAHRDLWAAKLAGEHLRSVRRAGQLTGGVEPALAPGPAPSAPGTDLKAGAGAVLTETELRIAHFVARGMTNQQIARSLRRSPHTVSYHLRHIFEKLKIKSRVELVAYLLREQDT